MLISVVYVGSCLEFNHVDVLPSLFPSSVWAISPGRYEIVRFIPFPIPAQVASQTNVAAISLTHQGCVCSAGCAKWLSPLGFSIQLFDRPGAFSLAGYVFTPNCWVSYVHIPRLIVK